MHSVLRLLSAAAAVSPIFLSDATPVARPWSHWSASREVVHLAKRADPFDCDGYSVTLGDVIGEGSFGKVYRAEATKDDETLTIAVKEGTGSSRKSLLRGGDIVINHLSQNDHIGRIFGSCSVSPAEGEDEVGYLLMDLLVGSDMQKKYNDGYYAGSNEHVQSHFSQVLDGVAYIHENGYAHNDLWFPNWFVVDSEDVVKIIDFDFASLIGSPGKVCEAYQGLPTKRDGNDVWETGYFLLKAMNKKNPWQGADEGNLGEQIWAMDNRDDAATTIHEKFPMVSESFAAILAKVFAPQDSRSSAADFRDDVLATDELFDPDYDSSTAKVSTIDTRDDEVEVCISVPIVGSNGTTTRMAARW